MKARLDLGSSLRTRLLLGMGLMLLPVVALAIAGYVSSRAMVDAIEEVVDEQVNELQPVSNVIRLVLRAGMPPNDYLITGDEAERGAFERLAGEVDAQLAQLQASRALGSAEEQALLDEALAEWGEARQGGRELLALPRARGDAETVRRMKAFDAHLVRANEALAGLYDRVQVEVRRFEERSQAVRTRANGFMTAVTLLSFVLAFGAAWLLSRSITVPIRVLQDAILRFAEGDHSFRVTMEGSDELARVAETMNQLAHRLEHDQLTGAASRGALQRRLREEVVRAERYGRAFSVLMVDVDHFKRVNDGHGHEAGDRALKTVADRISRGLRAADTVCRYGGDEFTVILPESTGPGAKAIAERLRAAVAAEPIAVAEGVSLPLTVTVGLAAFPADAEDEAALLAAADRALYAAKAWGRNRVVDAATVDATRGAAGEEPASPPRVASAGVEPGGNGHT